MNLRSLFPQAGLSRKREAGRLRLAVSMLSAEEIRSKLEPYSAGQGEILPAYLFGSAAQGRMNRLSDIDIALLVDEEKFKELDIGRPYGYKAAMIAGLMGLLRMNEIDLVLLHQASPLLANEVISEGSLLFCRDEDVRIAFEVSVKHRYIDTEPLRPIKRHYLYERIDRDEFSKVRLP
ncbi:nucleotidyltransferase domain-containing protein [Candidatus Bipolaricaulota bacterium]|nr:nucleotidyltransferase domain-containing protein [Candidatus Bipolaricaulota bacterium]